MSHYEEYGLKAVWSGVGRFGPEYRNKVSFIVKLISSLRIRRGKGSFTTLKR